MNWNLINKLSSTITVGNIIYTIILLFFRINFDRLKKYFRRKKALKNIEQSGILIVGINEDRDPEIAVKKFIKKDTKLSKISESNITTLLIKKGNKNIILKDVEKFKKRFRKEIGQMSEKGIVIKHVFLMCPMTIAAIIGSELSNNGRNFIYQQNQDIYENWGELSKY